MKLRTVITTATTAAVLATGGVALAGATGTSTPTSSTSTTASSVAATGVTSAPKASTPATKRLRRHHRRLRVRALVRKVVLETIGIDRATLRRELRRGQTIADIATAHHVDPQTVVDALVAAATTKLDAAASAGRITADRAHAVEARLPARFTKLVDTWHPRRFRNAA